LPNFATLAIAILPDNWQNSGQNNFAPYTKLAHVFRVVS
jgi:hypothetical protein